MTKRNVFVTVLDAGKFKDLGTRRFRSIKGSPLLQKQAFLLHPQVKGQQASLGAPRGPALTTIILGASFNKDFQRTQAFRLF